MAVIIYDIPTYVSYTAVAGQQVFPFLFKFFTPSDVNVKKNGVVLTRLSQYTVQGAMADGGMQITLLTPAAHNDNIFIWRHVPYDRQANYPLTGPFRTESLNIEQARHVAMIQQLHDENVIVLGAMAEKVSRVGDIMTGPLQMPPGSPSVPSIRFSGDLDVGIYGTGDSVSVTIEGQERLFIGSGATWSHQVLNLQAAMPVSYNHATHKGYVDQEVTSAKNLSEPKITAGTINDYWRGDKVWTPVTSLPISTATQTALNGKVPEAPADGKVYGRQNNQWIEVTGTLRASIYYGDAPPAGPIIGQLWWETDSGLTYVYYQDVAGPPQWVQMAGGIGGTPDYAGTLKKETPPPVLTTVINYTPPQLEPNQGITITVPFPDADVGDFVAVAINADQLGVNIFGWVSAKDVISVRYHNLSGNVRNIGRATLRINLTKGI